MAQATTEELMTSLGFQFEPNIMVYSLLVRDVPMFRVTSEMLETQRRAARIFSFLCHAIMVPGTTVSLPRLALPHDAFLPGEISEQDLRTVLARTGEIEKREFIEEVCRRLFYAWAAGHIDRQAALTYVGRNQQMYLGPVVMVKAAVKPRRTSLAIKGQGPTQLFARAIFMYEHPGGARPVPASRI